MNYIYEIFTKPRWELSILDTLTGLGVIFGVIIGCGMLWAIFEWLCGKIKKRWHK